MKRVVIVGAGVVGLCCAVRLAKSGARVTLVEAESADIEVWGTGASAAAAGMLAPLSHAATPHDALAFQSLDLWHAGQAGAEWADGVRFGGGVLLAENAIKAEGILACARRHGRRAEFLGAGSFRRRCGFEAKPEFAVFTEDEAVADPIRVLTGLYMQARLLGVTLAYGRDVFEASPNLVRTFEGDAFEADAVVLAPGAWASDALKQAAPALAWVSPAKGQLLPVALPAGFDANVRASDFYLARRLGDAVLGASFEPGAFDRRVDPAQAESLARAAAKRLGVALQPAGKAWTGIRPMSPDGWPLIGDGGAGVLIAAGHSRNGWLLAPLTAEIVTAYVFGHTVPPEWAGLSPQRFGPP
jgi:glycine oxidase